MHSLGFVMMVACGIAFYRIGKLEYDKGFLLGVISILVWLGTNLGLHWGWLGCLGGQVGFFALLTLINVFRKPGFK